MSPPCFSRKPAPDNAINQEEPREPHMSEAAGSAKDSAEEKTPGWLTRAASQVPLIRKGMASWATSPRRTESREDRMRRLLEAPSEVQKEIARRSPELAIAPGQGPKIPAKIYRVMVEGIVEAALGKARMPEGFWSPNHGRVVRIAMAMSGRTGEGALSPKLRDELTRALQHDGILPKELPEEGEEVCQKTPYRMPRSNLPDFPQLTARRLSTLVVERNNRLALESVRDVPLCEMLISDREAPAELVRAVILQGMSFTELRLELMRRTQGDAEWRNQFELGWINEWMAEAAQFEHLPDDVADELLEMGWDPEKQRAADLVTRTTILRALILNRAQWERPEVRRRIARERGRYIAEPALEALPEDEAIQLARDLLTEEEVDEQLVRVALDWIRETGHSVSLSESEIARLLTSTNVKIREGALLGIEKTERLPGDRAKEASEPLEDDPSLERPRELPPESAPGIPNENPGRLTP